MSCTSVVDPAPSLLLTMGREGGIIDLAIFSLLFFFSIKKIYNKNKNKESNEIDSLELPRKFKPNLVLILKYIRLVQTLSNMAALALNLLIIENT
jgi:hypothetical protein